MVLISVSSMFVIVIIFDLLLRSGGCVDQWEIVLLSSLPCIIINIMNVVSDFLNNL